jgi:CheY-like chemotaxis protein
MRRFLLVDDSRVMRQMLKNALVAAGAGDAEFLEAADGEDAWTKLREVDFEADGVFCDLNMPRLDGLALIDRLRAEGRIESCPVIVITGDLRERRGAEALSRGARDLIAKPFTVASVAGAVERALGQAAKPCTSP